MPSAPSRLMSKSAPEPVKFKMWLKLTDILLIRKRVVIGRVNVDSGIREFPNRSQIGPLGYNSNHEVKIKVEWVNIKLKFLKWFWPNDQSFGVKFALCPHWRRSQLRSSQNWRRSRNILSTGASCCHISNQYELRSSSNFELEPGLTDILTIKTSTYVKVKSGAKMLNLKMKSINRSEIPDAHHPHLI